MSFDISKPGKLRLPVFVFCKDRRYYEGLIYQDHPMRREWFICFDETGEEPAELVRREDVGIDPMMILEKRGFKDCTTGVFNGRTTPHKRFFGANPITGEELECHDAVSWYIMFRKGRPLPTPCEYDSILESYPVLPGRDGIVFGK